MISVEGRREGRRRAKPKREPGWVLSLIESGTLPPDKVIIQVRLADAVAMVLTSLCLVSLLALPPLRQLFLVNHKPCFAYVPPSSTQPYLLEASSRIQPLTPQLSVSAMAAGGVCLIFAVFSGPVLICLLVIALGISGVCRVVTRRGILTILPRDAVELLTRTSLLDWLTDSGFFDSVKPYLVFLMGLTKDEAQLALRALPPRARMKMMRPGLLHALPIPVQNLLMPGWRPLAADMGQGDGAGSRQEQGQALGEAVGHGRVDIRSGTIS
ncbi:unnamed protein product, partial [Discosporangium mesarthrocarpum]